MKFWQHFIPHQKNRFHPTVLRLPSMVGIGLVMLVLLVPSFGFQASGSVLGYATSISVSDLHSLSNQQRSSNGLNGYGLSSKLSQAAAAKAQHMFSNNYWAHTAPDGTTPWYFISAAGYSYSLAGENLAKDFSTSSGVVNGWMGSSGHRANVLNTSFSEVGYAAVNGTLQGKQTTLVVAMYAAPKAASQSKAATKASTPAPASTAVPDTSTQSTAATPQPASKPAPKPATPKKATPAAPVSSASKQTEQPYTTESTGQVLNEQTLDITAPARLYAALSWQQRLVIMLLAYLALINILKHTLIWRQQKRGYRHIWWRHHPLLQAAALIFGIIVVSVSSAGVVL